ncbi:ferredoxin [Cupriavidus sp. 2TAF22]|uniref:ferredoxin n=1 Tax=unclassified Cupriavidus TaxID=2640874 RepID=UPI003F92727D
MYVILSSRDGHYRTELDGSMAPVESYDYLFYGRRRARFVIASLAQPVKVRIVDCGPPERVSLVPSRLLPQYPTLEAARSALNELVSFGTLDVRLERSAVDATGEPA